MHLRLLRSNLTFHDCKFIIQVLISKFPFPITFSQIIASWRSPLFVFHFPRILVVYKLLHRKVFGHKTHTNLVILIRCWVLKEVIAVISVWILPSLACDKWGSPQVCSFRPCNLNVTNLWAQPLSALINQISVVQPTFFKFWVVDCIARNHLNCCWSPNIVN
jgi:hypothetical protein